MRQLIADHHAAVYRYALRLSGNQADAEDLAQQTFVNAQQRLEQLRDPGRAGGWLLAIARHCFCRLARKRRPVSAEAAEIDLDQTPDTSQPSDLSDREALETALRALPEAYRTVLMMFFFEHLSYREIAAELDIPDGTVMSRLSRAKIKLRELLVASSESSTIGNASDQTARRRAVRGEPSQRREPERGA